MFLVRCGVGTGAVAAAEQEEDKDAAVDAFLGDVSRSITSMRLVPFTVVSAAPHTRLRPTCSLQQQHFRNLLLSIPDRFIDAFPSLAVPSLPGYDGTTLALLVLSAEVNPSSPRSEDRQGESRCLGIYAQVIAAEINGRKDVHAVQCIGGAIEAVGIGEYCVRNPGGVFACGAGWGGWTSLIDGVAVMQSLFVVCCGVSMVVRRSFRSCRKAMEER